MERARKRKQNHDKGFSSFEAATARQYHSLVDQIRPDMEDYEAKKQKMGSNFFPTSNTVIHGTHQDSPEALERYEYYYYEADRLLSKYTVWALHNLTSKYLRSRDKPTKVK